MKFYTLLVISLFALVGCVQQTTYSGKDKVVVEQDIDPVAASRERLTLGLAYLRRGNSEQAKYNFERALKHTPNSPDALVSMAYYYDAVKDDVRAEEFYRKSVAARPFNADSANAFGAFLCRQQQYKEADSWFNKAVQTPGYIRIGQTYENLGLCAEQAGWIEKAADYYERALNHNPNRASSLLQVAELKFKSNDVEAASLYLSRYHDNGYESAASLWLAAQMEFADNNSDAARRFGVLLLAKYPSSEQAQAYRTKYY